MLKALLLALATSTTNAPDTTTTEVIQLIAQHRSAEAVVKLDTAIAGYESDKSGTVFRCARSAEEIMAVTLGAVGGQAKKTSVVSAERCYAYFLKGFSLIDLGQRDSALPYLLRAVEMGPHISQFRSELAEYYKGERDWRKAHDLFVEAAADARTYEYPNVVQLGRALRGTGYTSIEMGKLDEAEASFNEAIQLNPGDERAKSELDYIHTQKAKAHAPTF